MPKYHCLKRGILIEAALLPLLITAGFRSCGVARTQDRLRRWSSGRRTEGGDQPIRDVRRAQRAVRRRLGIGGSCLVRSLTLWTMLRRRGIDTELRVGMRRREGRVEGHAWVEYEGRPINEADDVIRTYSAHPDPVAFDAVFWTE